MAKAWSQVKADAAARGRKPDAAKVAAAREQLLDEIRAHRLAEVRKSASMTQVELAAEMGVTQSRVSKLEAGDLDATELGTIRKYVHSLGGELHLVADFPDQTVKIST